MSDEHFSQIGRMMFLIAWIILFALMFVVFYLYSDSGSSTVHSVTSHEYSLSADKTGHYWIKGKINDVPVVFLVDTGATVVAIPKSLADKLNLKGRYPMTISTANGQVEGSLTRLKELVFGEFVLHDVKAVIIPGNDDQEVLLGMNVLSQFNLTQDGKKLILRRQ